MCTNLLFISEAAGVRAAYSVLKDAGVKKEVKEKSVIKISFHTRDDTRTLETTAKCIIHMSP